MLISLLLRHALSHQQADGALSNLLWIVGVATSAFGFRMKCCFLAAVERHLHRSRATHEERQKLIYCVSKASSAWIAARARC